MNPAGRDLLNWCASEGLEWVHSVFNERKWVTWRHAGNKTWHKLDGFLTKQTGRNRWVRSVKSLNLKQKLSDHQPKQSTANLNFRKNRDGHEQQSWFETNPDWGEIQKNGLKRHLVENKLLIDVDYRPYRTILKTKYQESYEFVLLGDSILFGIFMDKSDQLKLLPVSSFWSAAQGGCGDRWRR